MSEVDELQDELIQEFLVECNEGLDKLDRDLVALDADPSNTEVLFGIFRTFHTIKGAAGFLAFQKLESVAHAAENLLSKLRDGSLAMNTRRANALPKTVDVLRAILSAIESTREEGDADYVDLLENLKRLQQRDQDGNISNDPASHPEISARAGTPANESIQLPDRTEPEATTRVVAPSPEQDGPATERSHTSVPARLGIPETAASAPATIVGRNASPSRAETAPSIGARDAIPKAAGDPSRAMLASAPHIDRIPWIFSRAR